MPEPQIEDEQTLNDIRAYASEIKSTFAQRDLDAKAYEDMYLMSWIKADDERFSAMRVTQDPDARNAVEGATRLMIANKPTFSLEGELERDKAEPLEKALTSWWDASGHAARQPHEHELVRSGLLYASMDAALSPTQELLAFARKGKNKALIAAAEATADRTPFLVDVWNPKQGYPAYDIFGLAAYYRQVDMTAADAEARYGKLPEDTLRKGAARGRYQNVTVNIFYDREWYALWINDFPLVCKKHRLPFIPVMSQIVDGSMLFDKPEFQRQPILYTLLRSGLWDSMNTYLTVAFTAILAMGTVGKWLHTAPTTAPGKRLDINWKDFVIEMEQGENLAPLVTKGLLDPDAAHMYELASVKAEQSTLYKQAMGAPVSKNTTFSELSLLSQQGRLPLIGTQKKGGWGIAELARMMLVWGKATPSYLKGTKLRATDIPKNPEVACALKVQLPQDELQNANIVRLLTQGDDPLTSKAWALEHVLGIGQPEQMQTDIWNERANNLMFLQTIQQIMREAVGQATADQAQRARGAQSFGQQPGPMQPGMREPTQTAGPGMAPGQAEAISGGLPPQQAGMIPGPGQGAIPPGAEPLMNPNGGGPVGPGANG